MLFFSSLKDISKNIQKRLKAEVQRDGTEVLHVFAFGYKFDSAFWIGVRTDTERDCLLSDEALRARLNAIIAKTGYAEKARKKYGVEFRKAGHDYLFDIGVTFESQETVDRTFDGNWWLAMK